MSKLIKRLEQLESEIESGFRSIGKALIEIHSTKAYQEQYETFEVYCKKRWNLSDRHARRIIDAEAVRIKIGHLCPVETLKTQHLLAIAEIPAAKQAQVAASVIADCEAENRKPTEKDFKDAAKEFVQPKADPKPETKDDWPGDKDGNPWPTDMDEPVDAKPADVWEDADEESSKQEQAETPQALIAPIQAVATHFNGHLKELTRLRDCIGGEWLDITDLETQIKLLNDSIRKSVYWIDCMDCGGKGCKTCRQLGWLSLDRKKFLTQEQKDKVGL